MNASVKLLESVLPASVHLRVEVPAGHPSAQILGTERMGSGTLIDGSGLVVTVNYVVLGASSVEVTFLDGTSLRGVVVAQDFTSGLALITVTGARFPAVVPQPSTTHAVGQEVFVVAATGTTQRRVNSGAISSLAPFDAFWEYRLDRGLVTTAMNPGLGGGGLFATNGRLIGVVSLDLNEVGRFTFAIPIEYFLDHRDELLRHGYRASQPPRAWVGLYCYDLRDHVVVAGVLAGAPGAAAGLKPGDVVLLVDGEPVDGRVSLYQRLWTHKPGDLIMFQIYRNNAVKQVAVQSTDAQKFFA